MKKIGQCMMLVVMLLVLTACTALGRANACAYCNNGTIHVADNSTSWTDTSTVRNCTYAGCSDKKDKKQKRQTRKKYTCNSCGYTYYSAYKTEYRWYCCSKHIETTDADSIN